MSASRRLPSETHTERFAADLARALPADTAGWRIALAGDLGSGKSTLVRALLAAWGHTGVVPSPTYTLVEPYEIAGRRVYHIDLYRINDPEEVYYLGVDELHDGLALIEWPERAPLLAAGADLGIRLEYAGRGRLATLDAGSDRGAVALAALTAAEASEAS